MTTNESTALPTAAQLEERLVNTGWRHLGPNTIATTGSALLTYGDTATLLIGGFATPKPERWEAATNVLYDYVERIGAPSIRQ